MPLDEQEVIPDTPETPVTPEAETQPEPQDESETSTDQPGDESADESKVKPRNGGFQKRIDQLTRNNRELASQLQLAIQKFEGATTPKTEAALPVDKPALDQYATYEDYIAGLMKWQVKNERETEKAAEATRTRLSEQEKKAQRFEELCEDIRKDVPDFDDIAFDPSLRLTNMMVETIQESDMGPRILLHLQKNHAEAKRIAALNPVAQIKEIGRIEEKLSSRVASTSKAPDPINPIRNNASAMTGLRDDLPIDQWMKMREKQSRTK